MTIDKSMENKYFKQESIFEKRTMSPIFRSNDIERGRDIMTFYPLNSTNIHTCDFCKKGFSTSQALGGHLTTHKHEQKWIKKRKETETRFPEVSFSNPYQEKPHLLLGGYLQESLTNDNYLGINLDLIKPIKRSFSSRVIRGNMDTEMTIVPRVTPRFLKREYSPYGSSSYKDIRPRTTKCPSNLFSKDNVLREENLISKIGANNVVVIDDDDDDDDDDDQEEEKSRICDIDLSLSL
ncbi:unnamed protein product [Cochlearia groenlandica]